MSSNDRELGFLVATIGVVAWTYVVGLDRLRHRMFLVGLALSLSFFVVSWFSLQSDPLALIFAAFNRAGLAALGIVIGYQLTVHLLAAKRRRRRDG